MNLLKKIFTGFLFTAALALLGSGQAMANDGLSYSLITYDGNNGKTIHPASSEIAYSIVISNNSSTDYTNVSISPTQICLNSIAGTPNALNGTINLGCSGLSASSVAAGTFELAPYSSKVVPIKTAWYISSPKGNVTIKSTGAEASLVAELDFTFYSSQASMHASAVDVLRAFTRQAPGDNDGSDDLKDAGIAAVLSGGLF